MEARGEAVSMWTTGGDTRAVRVLLKVFLLSLSSTRRVPQGGGG